MRGVTLSKMAFLLLGLFSFPGMAWCNSLLVFPDPTAFEGITLVVVAPITFLNMEKVNLAPESLQASMQDQLRKAEIAVNGEENLKRSAQSGEGTTKNVGHLAATVRRWETSGLMGSTMNSFAISLRFFQKARVEPSQHESWVMTWLGTKSVLVGTMRPKGISDALDELLQSFILDFKKGT